VENDSVHTVLPPKQNIADLFVVFRQSGFSEILATYIPALSRLDVTSFNPLSYLNTIVG